MGKLIDETGHRYGRLTVIKKVPNPTKTQTGAYWECLCDCGNIKQVSAAHLRRGLIQSCGCLGREKTREYNLTHKLIDLTGQKFGKLIVLERAENKGEQPVWKCQCECGTITYVMGGNLRKENGTQSCGCLLSKGELKIAKLLTENNIVYKKEVSFKDCLSPKGALLRFDFGIYKDNELQYLIEYNGIQHYEKTGYTKDTYEERQKRDLIKIEYCKAHNIPLIIIPYSKFDTLTIEDLILKGNRNK